jgi:nickel-dependent lactate racemase
MLNSDDRFRVAKLPAFQLLAELSAGQSNDFKILILVAGGSHRRQIFR